jgi:hypothetical protein
VHLTERHFALEEKVLNTEKSVIYAAGTRKPKVSKREEQREFREKVSLNKETYIEKTFPLT